jgi:uncharacterized membrane protein YgaE (UPF0421/DUF939 family)
MRHQLDGRRTELVKALRAALAAAIAWEIAQLLGAHVGGPIERYAYYAPLGAVVAITGTVAGSVRESAQALGAVLLGAALALLVEPVAAWGGPALGAALGVAVGIGMVISTWHRLGSLGSWVPVAAMFVLLTGSSHLEDYLIGYVGLMTLGAVVGVVANAVFAPLPLRRSGREVRELRDTLAAQLCDAAGMLRRPEPPTQEEWEAHQRTIIPLSRQVSDMVTETSEARRANWRARRWMDALQRQYELARSLEQLAYLVDDLVTVLRRDVAAELDQVALGPRLRPRAADLLDALSGLLDGLDEPLPGDEALRKVDHAIGVLVDEIRRTRGETGDDLFTAGAIVLAAKRAVTALTPDDVVEEMPSLR